MNGLDAAVQKETAVLTMMDAFCPPDSYESDDSFGFDCSAKLNLSDPESHAKCKLVLDCQERPAIAASPNG